MRMRKPVIGGGSGGGLNAGNSVATPQPVSFAPGLNSIWVLGENMQAACGLNHQLALGSNQQICINPAEVLSVLGVSGGDLLTGIIGGGQAGNIQLTVGASAAVAFGQAFEINLGPEKVSIDAGYKSQVVTGILCAGLAAAATLYIIGYALKSNSSDYKDCAIYTLAYQASVDALLMAIMIYVTMTKEADDLTAAIMNKAFGVLPALPPPDPGASAVWKTIAESAVLLAAMAVPLAETGEDDREDAEHHQQVDPKPACPPTCVPAGAQSGPAGGGSGGGIDKSDATQRHRTIVGNRVEIVARRVKPEVPPDPEAAPTSNVITLLATGETETGLGTGGLVELRGNQGVRITSGPPLPGLLDTSSPSTDGIEMIASENQKVTIQQGVADPHKITLATGGVTVSGGLSGAVKLKEGGFLTRSELTLAEGSITAKSAPFGSIDVNAGLGGLTLESLTSITLKVAGGMASIKITPMGIELKGLIVQIN